MEKEWKKGGKKGRGGNGVTKKERKKRKNKELVKPVDEVGATEITKEITVGYFIKYKNEKELDLTILWMNVMELEEYERYKLLIGKQNREHRQNGKHEWHEYNNRWRRDKTDSYNEQEKDFIKLWII